MKKSLWMLITMFFAGFLWNTKAVSWQEYKKKYLKEEGYIIDPYNQNRVTSEAQGYGLILAVKNNDRQTFDRIYNWTKKNMQREDKLFSWHWNGSLVDKNNATDGDLLISYGLLLAYRKWKENYYQKEFSEINNSLKRLIVNILAGNCVKSLLLPAAYGFSNEKYEITIYPSYYIDFVLKELSREDRDWNQVYRFIDKINAIKNLSTQLKFSLISKEMVPTEYSDMDVYRVILYSYVAGRDLSALRDSFKEIDGFFKTKGYIPIRFHYGRQEQEKSESPFCVYRMFYLLYKDGKYIEKYRELKEVDQQNYFCDSLELLLEES